MLTREKVLEMKPGSKLDLLVCEKVMKWITPWEPFFPSTDISAAWEVVGKLQNDYVLDFKLERKYCVAAMKFVAVFEDLDGKKWVAHGWIAPEAICKAALLAVMDGEEPNHDTR